MKYIFFFFALVCACACTQTYQDKIKNILSQHLEPSEKNDNKLSVGKTIVFEHSEGEGIDRSRYPAPTYPIEADKSYFEFVKTEEVNDGADGGSTYYFDIYKAIKKGTTKINRYKVTPIPLKSEPADTLPKQNIRELYGTYAFTIE
jgi:hypothetical protein